MMGAYREAGIKVAEIFKGDFENFEKPAEGFPAIFVFNI